MKVLGIGVDIVENKSFRNLIKNKNFLMRIFGKKEIELSKKIKNRINFFAKRFAAKESFAKSIGTGIRDNLSFNDIQILNDSLGKPYYVKSKKIIRVINKRYKIKICNLFLAISDEKDYSIAFTILQSK